MALKNEDVLYTDFQGWPVYKKTLREIIELLGGKIQYDESNNPVAIGFDINDPILDVYPTTLEDDGMGYGVNEMFISGADYNKDKNILHIWRDKKDE